MCKRMPPSEGGAAPTHTGEILLGFLTTPERPHRGVANLLGPPLGRSPGCCEGRIGHEFRHRRVSHLPEGDRTLARCRLGEGLAPPQEARAAHDAFAVTRGRVRERRFTAGGLVGRRENKPGALRPPPAQTAHACQPRHVLRPLRMYTSHGCSPAAPVCCTSREGRSPTRATRAAQVSGRSRCGGFVLQKPQCLTSHADSVEVCLLAVPTG